MTWKVKQDYHSQYTKVPHALVETAFSPADVDFDAGRVQYLRDHFARLVDTKRIQAAYWLMARKGKIFAWEALGRQSYHSENPVNPFAIRDIASQTKLITTVALFQLYEKGYLDLYAPVAEHIEEFNNDMHKGITPMHLLTHTSGILADGGYFLEPYPEPWIDKNSDSWIKAFLHGALRNKPGTVWSYSSRGFMLLGEIIQRVSGKCYEDYIEENIFKVLKMEDSSFKVSASKMERYCSVSKEDEKWGIGSRPKKSKTYPPPSSGGIKSTLYDLYLFAQALLDDGVLEGKRIISRKSIELMMKNQLKDVPAFSWGRDFKNYPYGSGVVIEKDQFMPSGTFGHEGAGASGTFIDKKNGLIYSYFVPFSGDWVSEAVDNPRAIIHSGVL